jgi:hypothetical protein
MSDLGLTVNQSPHTFLNMLMNGLKQATIIICCRGFI